MLIDVMIVTPAGIFHIKLRIGSANVAARTVLAECLQTAKRASLPFQSGLLLLSGCQVVGNVRTET
jgi:hypothetical protein